MFSAIKDYDLGTFKYVIAQIGVKMIGFRGQEVVCMIKL